MFRTAPRTLRAVPRKFHTNPRKLHTIPRKFRTDPRRFCTAPRNFRRFFYVAWGGPRTGRFPDGAVRGVRAGVLWGLELLRMQGIIHSSGAEHVENARTEDGR